VVHERSPAGEMGLDESTYRQHAPRLMALAAALVGPSRAEDVVAGAVVRLLTSPHWPSDDPGTALTRSVVNEARSLARSELRRAAREALAARAPAGATARDGDAELLARLLRLPLQQRAATFLTYWADLPPAAVAEQLGISDGAVRKHLARARATLRKELA
jgi:RNA polymerase sigma-70 factor (ECF subfamily)